MVYLYLALFKVEFKTLQKYIKSISKVEIKSGSYRIKKNKNGTVK